MEHSPIQVLIQNLMSRIDDIQENLKSNDYLEIVNELQVLYNNSKNIPKDELTQLHTYNRNLRNEIDTLRRTINDYKQEELDSLDKCYIIPFNIYDETKEEYKGFYYYQPETLNHLLEYENQEEVLNLEVEDIQTINHLNDSILEQQEIVLNDWIERNEGVNLEMFKIKEIQRVKGLNMYTHEDGNCFIKVKIPTIINKELQYITKMFKNPDREVFLTEIRNVLMNELLHQNNIDYLLHIKIIKEYVLLKNMFFNITEFGVWDEDYCLSLLPTLKYDNYTIEISKLENGNNVHSIYKYSFSLQDQQNLKEFIKKVKTLYPVIQMRTCYKFLITYRPETTDEYITYTHLNNIRKFQRNKLKFMMKRKLQVLLGHSLKEYTKKTFDVVYDVENEKFYLIDDNYEVIDRQFYELGNNNRLTQIVKLFIQKILKYIVNFKVQVNHSYINRGGEFERWGLNPNDCF